MTELYNLEVILSIEQMLAEMPIETCRENRCQVPAS